MMKTRPQIYWLVCYFIFIFLLGCNVGPDYQRPEVAAPHSYKEASPKGMAKQPWKVATPNDTVDRGPWWAIFNDPILNNLEERAMQCNQNIALAQAQYQQALALVMGAQAGFFPTLSANLGDMKSRNQSLLSSPNSSSSSSAPSNTASVEIQASWELDLWGNVRRLVEADEAAAQASKAQLAAIQLSTQATLAQTYFQLRALDEAQAMLDDSVAAYEKFLTLTKNQYKAGTASQMAILQADAQLRAIRLQAIDNGVLRAQFEHAIAVLTNYPPGNFSIAKRTSRLVVPMIPLEVPSALLERRPDIANAERLMAQANAQIGVATSAFFPMLTLTGDRSYEKQSFGNLLTAPAIVWSLGAQLSEAIFDGGSRCAAVMAADATYQATVATYRQTVLAAFQDVEDNLAAFRILNDESAVQDQAVITAEKQLTYTMNQYKAGTVSHLDVLNALFGVYVAKRNSITIASRQLTAVVGLIKALGGNYAHGS
jgi:NodT family efflux transporter outer membrane factor (OMF) lipoprotein